MHVLGHTDIGEARKRGLWREHTNCVGSSILIVRESQRANRRKRIYSQPRLVEVLVRDLSLPNKH